LSEKTGKISSRVSSMAVLTQSELKLLMLLAKDADPFVWKAVAVRDLEYEDADAAFLVNKLKAKAYALVV
jgi:hypothetical protein